VLAALAAGGCADGGYAARIDGETVSVAEFEDELDEVATNEQIIAPEDTRGDAPGSYNQAFVGQFLRLRILLEVVAAEVESRGLQLTDEHRDIAVEQFLGGDQGIEEFGSRYRTSIVDDYARVVALAEDLGSGDELDALLGELLTDTEIQVNSRYGRWDAPNAAVVPPEGPRPAPVDS
jgi:hypothetical protein